MVLAIEEDIMDASYDPQDPTLTQLTEDLRLTRYLYQNPGTTTDGYPARTLSERLSAYDTASRALRQYTAS
jgi:hypothetical protein